jgi:hypothetical protein
VVPNVLTSQVPRTKITAAANRKQMIAANRFLNLPRALKLRLGTPQDHKDALMITKPAICEQRATDRSAKDACQLRQDDPPDDEDPPSCAQPAAQCDTDSDEQCRVHQIWHDRDRQHRDDVVPLG